jgi:hypothetical protein
MTDLAHLDHSVAHHPLEFIQAAGQVRHPAALAHRVGVPPGESPVGLPAEGLA